MVFCFHSATFFSVGRVSGLSLSDFPSCTAFSAVAIASLVFPAFICMSARRLMLK